MYLNCDEATLQSLVMNVLKDRLGINEPSITIGSNVIYEEGQDAEEFLKVSERITLLGWGWCLAEMIYPP